jgi:hypothetical protein
VEKWHFSVTLRQVFSSEWKQKNEKAEKKREEGRQ